jgi:hypothetical protein
LGLAAYSVSSLLIATSIAGERQCDLDFVMTSERTTILKYEPLEVQRFVTNKSTAEIKSIIGARTLEGMSFQCDDGPFRGWRQGWVGLGAEILAPDIIPAGKTMNFPVELVWHRNHPIFEQSGKYTIRSEWASSFGWHRDDLIVNVITGEAREKKCVAEMESLRIQGYLGLDAHLVLLQDRAVEPGKNWKTTLQSMYEIVERYGDTPYATYYLSSLLLILSARDQFDVRPSEIDPAFKEKVATQARIRIASKPDPRTLYAYTEFLRGKDRDLERWGFLREAQRLSPDCVLKGRIDRAERNARPDDFDPGF